MGESGLDVAGARCPWGFECKAVESLSIWAALEQAELNAAAKNVKPALVFRRNHTAAYVAIRFEDFLALLPRLQQGDGGTDASN